jgi:glycosyltransferase involved in cell wall biosynthesis
VLDDVRISVALCTYQGEKYLEEQLDSIAWQTRPPNELIVCDDGSSDETRTIVRRFQTGVPFAVRLYTNEARLGPTKNFERAISLCEGDFIFLADQDDVWDPEKLRILASVLGRSSEVGAVFSDADVVDERLVPQGSSLWEIIEFTRALQKRFMARGALQVLMKRNVISGMTMGFRARFRDLVVPMPADWFHDCWIPLLIAAVGNVAMVPLRLVKYRQHPKQEVGIPKRGLASKIAGRRKVDSSAFLHEAKQYEAARARLIECMASYPSSTSVVRQFHAKSRHIQTRARIRSHEKRFRLLLRETLALNYQRYSSGVRSIAVDMLLSQKDNAPSRKAHVRSSNAFTFPDVRRRSKRQGTR